MLILKEPIKLKSLSPIVSPSDSFFERMDANYKQMQAKYNPEELFHFLNQPPEFAAEEGGMTTIVTQNQNQMNQEVRVEMIQNLFNRLMMADSSDFTYQDTVFVQNMLEKLGVKNVAEFMHQLYGIQEDIKNTKQLLHIYNVHASELTAIIETVKSEGTGREKELDKEENTAFPLYWIHNEIFRRLQTGNVYHTIVSFQKGMKQNQERIDSREIELAAQLHISEALSLQRLESKVLMKESPFLEHRVNIYEGGIQKGGYEKTEIINELAQAVLLNLSESLYQTGLEQRNSRKSFWYQFSGDFHRILEDTLKRFSAYHFQDVYDTEKNITNQYEHQQNVNALRKEEIRQLNKILEVFSQAETKENIYLHETEGSLGFLQHLDYSKMSEEEYEQVKETIFEEYSRHSEEEVQKAVQSLKQMLKKRQEEERSVEENFRQISRQSEERLHYVVREEESQILQELNETNRIFEEQNENLERNIERERQLSEEIRILNEENRRRMEETERSEETLRNILPVQMNINKERTRKETLLLLEHPELLEQYMQDEAEHTTKEYVEQAERRKTEVEAELVQYTKQREELATEIVNLERMISVLQESQMQSRKNFREQENTVQINHRKAVDAKAMYTEICEKLDLELEKFLNHLKVEKQIEETQNISRIQEALSGRKVKRTETRSAESVAKRLTLLRSSLTEMTSGEAYLKVLRQMEQLVSQYHGKSSHLTEQSETLKEQKQLVLETLHTSEFRIQNEIEKRERVAKQTRLTQKEVRRLEKGIVDVRKAVKTYLDAISKEKREEEVYQSRRHVGKYQRAGQIDRELIHVKREDMQNTIEQIHRQEQSNVVLQSQNRTSFTNRTVQFYHKEPDTFFREMMEGQMIPAAAKRQTEQVNEEVHTQKIVTKQQIHTQTDNIVRKNSQNINEMINKGVQRQLQTISEQVYHKLEKKLSNDRKRRGY